MVQAHEGDSRAGQGRRRGPVSSGPDYSSQDFWEKRFAIAAGSAGAGVDDTAKPDFDWLGTGDGLLDALMDQLGAVSTSSDRWTLHIGSGSSRAGCQLRRRFEEKAWQAEHIVNIDYAPSAIALSRTFEEQCFGDVVTQHVVADLLDGARLTEALSKAGLPAHEAGVTAVFDKSTADALSTGPRLCATKSDNGRRSFAVADTTGVQEDDEEWWDPVEVLACNIGHLCRPGAIWAVLSYSEHRFDFLAWDHKNHGVGAKEARKLWAVTKTWSIEAPSGRGESDVHAPAVYHWCYLLTRIGHQ